MVNKAIYTTQEVELLSVRLKMKYAIIPFCLLLLLSIACSNSNQVEIKNDDGVVVERYELSKEDSTMHGSYEAFDEKGQLIEKSSYAKGKLDGVRTLYYPSGGVQYEETHLNGEFEGIYKAYYPEGELELEGKYVDNKMTGIWTAYYPNGTKKEAVTFVDNEENGPFTEWHASGTLKAEGSYANGDNEEGELVLYDLNGKVNKRMFCEGGICRTVPLETEETASNEE